MNGPENYKIDQSGIIEDPNNPYHKTSSWASLPMEQGDPNFVQGAPIPTTIDSNKNRFLKPYRIYGTLANAGLTSITVLQSISDHISTLNTAAGAIAISGVVFTCTEISPAVKRLWDNILGS